MQDLSSLGKDSKMRVVLTDKESKPPAAPSFFSCFSGADGVAQGEGSAEEVEAKGKAKKEVELVKSASGISTTHNKKKSEDEIEAIVLRACVRVLLELSCGRPALRNHSLPTR